jgi:hypothetical protein
MNPMANIAHSTAGEDKLNIRVLYPVDIKLSSLAYRPTNPSYIIPNTCPPVLTGRLAS